MAKRLAVQLIGTLLAVQLIMREQVFASESRVSSFSIVHSLRVLTHRVSGSRFKERTLLSDLVVG